MNYQYFNNCPDYYPADFNQYKYQQNLDTLLCAQGSISVRNHTFKRLSWIERIYNGVAWFFGFKDVTDSTRINGEILKFFHYGCLHDIINDNRHIQFQHLSSQGWIAPEVRIAINALSVLNITKAQKLNLIREQLSSYYSKNAQEFRPFFWKRRTSSPSVQMNKALHFGTTHLFKAALITDSTKNQKTLNQISWAVSLEDGDFEFQKKCFNSLEILLNRSYTISYSAIHLLPFIAKLAKNCITKGDYVEAENYLKKSVNLFGNYDTLNRPLKKIYFKQKRWKELTSSVEIFTKKFSKDVTKENKSLQKLASQARGIATIYQLCNCHYQTIDYLKKASKYDPNDTTINKKIAQAYKEIAFSETNLGVAIDLLNAAKKYDPNDQTISYEIASRNIQIGNAILEENNSFMSMASSFLKRSEPKSPQTFYQEAYAICPSMQGAHIQWLINNFEKQNLFKEALKIYKEASQLQPDYSYQLNSCKKYAYQTKNNNDFEDSYELFCIAHKFDPDNFSIKEEIVSTGLKLAKSLKKTDPMLAVKYLKELRPIVKFIEEDSISTLGIHSPHPKISEKNLEELIGAIAFKYAYNRALHSVNECRTSSLVTPLKDYKLFDQHKKDHKEQIDDAIGWLQKALSANPNSAEAHFELANFVKHFEIDGIDILEHYKKAIELKPRNYIYKLSSANAQDQLTASGGVDRVIATLTYTPQDCLKIYWECHENYYVKFEERFYTVNPHEMTWVSK